MIEDYWAQVLADFSISSRTVAFVVNVVREIGAGATVPRRVIEVATGVQHHRWPLEEAEGLGLSLVDRGEPGEELAGTWVFSPGHLVPTPTATTTSSTTEVPLYVQRTSRHTLCGYVLSALPDPLLDHWQACGRYCWDGWRLYVLAPDEVVDTRLIRSRLGMDDRRARRLLAALRAAGLVLDGRWNQRYLDEAEQHSTRRERIGDRVAREVQQWGARRKVISAAEQIVAGRFRTVAEVYGPIEQPPAVAPVPPPAEPRVVTQAEVDAFLARLQAINVLPR